MPPIYAQTTTVPVAKSRTEIEECLTRYGATKFAYFSEAGSGGDKAVVVFEARDRRILFELSLPSQEEFKTRRVNTAYGNHITRTNDPTKQLKFWEQACRQRWRALALVIKAKLEAVESGIATFEDEFLAHVVLPNGKRFGAWVAPQLEQALRTNKMPPMLPSGEK